MGLYIICMYIHHVVAMPEKGRGGGALLDFSPGLFFMVALDLLFILSQLGRRVPPRTRIFAKVF